MKKFIILILVFTVLFFGPTTQTFAHDELTDHGITGILHTDPDDDPLAKSPTAIFLELKQKNGQFDITHCLCQLLIQEQGKTLFTQPFTNATDISGTNPITSFTFPTEDKYNVVVAGTPRDRTSFSPFRLTYEVAVGREGVVPEDNWWSTHMIPLAALIVLGASTLFVVIRKMRQKKSALP